MSKYILSSIKKNKSLFIFTILALYIIFTVIPVSISALFTSKAIVNDDITKYSRGEYDILVRAEGSISEVEKKLGLVEENYLTSGTGGISLNQYYKIKSIEGIEAAAPVSTIGYFQSNMSKINLKFPFNKGYHAKFDIYTYDGVNEYLLNTFNTYQIPSSTRVDPNMDDSELPFLFIPYTTRGITTREGKIEYSIHLAYVWDLVVAIDPEEESKITNLEQKVTSGRYLTKEDKITVDYSNPNAGYNVLPILVNKNAHYPIKVKIQFENFNLDRESGNKIIKDILGEDIKSKLFNYSDYTPFPEDAYTFNGSENYKNIKSKVEKYIPLLESLPVKDKNINTIDVSGKIKPFTNTSLLLSRDGDNLITTKDGIYYNRDGVYYEFTPIKYNTNEIELQAIPVSEKDGITIFRGMTQKGSSIGNLSKDNLGIDFKIVGNISIAEEEKERFTGTPLGIYGDSFVYQVQNEKGEEVKNKKITPTINPGSFVPSAPHAYTTLEAAEIFKGEKPIDAIRVKVSGISKYDSNAKVKIERIAREISKETGLHVDIVAGSSVKNILVSIPGYKDTPSIGKVLERWTTLGAAARIAESFNSWGIVLVIAFIFSGLIFIINRVGCSLSSRKRETEILKALGWEGNKIGVIICGETTIAAVIAGFLSIITVLLLSNSGGLKSIFLIISITTPMGILLSSFTSYLYSKSEQRNIGMVDVNLKEKLGKNKFQNKSIIKMILNSLFTYRKKSALLILQILLTGGLGIFTWLSIMATRKSAAYTALGMKVNFSTEGMSQILIIGCILLVSFTILDRFIVMVVERKREIGILKTLGWRDFDVMKLIAGEAFLLSIAGTALAALFSLTAYNMLYKGFPVSILKLLVAFILLICFALISCIYPLYVAITISPVDIIMDRDMKSSFREAINFKWVAAGTLTCILLASAIFSSLYYIRVKKDKDIEHAMSLSVAEGIVDKFDEKAMLKHINTLSAKQNRFENNQLEAGNYIISELKKLGYTPKIDKFKVKEDIGIVESSLTIKAGEKIIKSDYLNINSNLIKVGKNTVKGRAVVFGNVRPDNYKDMIVFINPDISEEDINAEYNILKNSLALVYTSNTVEIEDVFDAAIEFDGAMVMREEALTNIEVNIKGEGQGNKTILLDAHYGSLGYGAGDNASGVSALLELSRLLKESPIENNVKILFSAGGEYDFSRGLRRYLEASKDIVDTVFIIDGIGTSEKMIFGKRDDTFFGEPVMGYGSSNNPIELEETKNLDNVIRRIQFLDKGNSYNLPRSTENSFTSPDEIMKLGNQLASKLKLSLSPARDDSCSGRVAFENQLNYTYISCNDDRFQTTEDKPEIINSKLLKKQAAFIYALLADR